MMIKIFNKSIISNDITIMIQGEFLQIYFMKCWIQINEIIYFTIKAINEKIRIWHVTVTKENRWSLIHMIGAHTLELKIQLFHTMHVKKESIMPKSAFIL